MAVQSRFDSHALIDNRQIRVFISSTFQDMQEERDYLMNKTFPVLRRLAAKRNVSIVEVDLRWGITKELSENNKTLQVCLDEIDNSRPFFIGILGDRYGWCPEESEYNNNQTIQDQYHWVLDCIKQGKSITEMEIQYGALNHEIRGDEDVQAFFYIKENSDETDIRLHELKELVRHNIDHHPCSNYSSPANLGDQVSEAFERILNTLYPEKELSVLERLRMEQESFISSRCNPYIPNKKNERYLDGFLCDGKKDRLLIVAPEGMGKSALLANWIVKHREENQFEWFYHFIGNTSDNCIPEDIALHLAMEIQQRGITIPANMPKNDKESGSGYLQRTISNLNPQKNIVIVLDGFDHLKDFGKDASVHDWLPVTPKGSKIIVSSVEDENSIKIFKLEKYEVHKLSALTIAERRQVVSKYLRRYGKRLTPAQEERIARYSMNPLVMRIILNEVRLFGNYEKLNSYIAFLVSHPSDESLFDAILQKAEQEYGCELVKKSLSWIQMSLDGLYESDIQKMIGCTPLNWSHFFCAFADCFIVRDGFLNFSNNMISKAVKRRYSDSETVLRKEFVRVLQSTKHIARDNAQKELVYQYFQLQDWKNLYKTIIQPSVFVYYRKNAVSLLADYWRHLMMQGRKRELSVYLKSDLKGYSLHKKVDYYKELATFCMGWYPDEANLVAQNAYNSIIKLYDQKKRKTNRENLDQINACIQGGIILSDFRLWYDDSSFVLKYALDQLDTFRTELTTEMKDAKASALFSLGNNLHKQEKYEESITFYKQAQELYVEILGKDSKDNVECLSNLGNAYCELFLKNKKDSKYYELSEKYYLEAISIAKKKIESGIARYISEYLDIYIVLLNNLGSIYSGSDQYEKAEKKYSAAFSLLRLFEGIDENRGLNNMLDCLYNMGIIFKKQKQYDKALPYFEEMLSKAKSKVEANPAKLDYVFTALGKMIQIYKELDSNEDVEKYKKESLALLDKYFPENEYDELRKSWALY